MFLAKTFCDNFVDSFEQKSCRDKKFLDCYNFNKIFQNSNQF